jgi:4-diphosphocytidyl-2-C-methyl-D-erythritol kinase
MTVSVRSFAKINLGLYIGALRADGFHELRTVYQTIALHDVIRVSVGRGSGIEIVCDDPRVPRDFSNSCWRMAELVMAELGASGRVRIEIEKRLPVQGGMGAASSNAVATMIGLERALGGRRGKPRLYDTARLRIASAVGSDLPLFVLGGTVLGVGRGEEVYPLADLGATPLVLVTPEVGVSTPAAFADWDSLATKTHQPRGARRSTGETQGPSTPQIASRRYAPVGMTRVIDAELTRSTPSDRILAVGRVLSSWLGGSPNTGAPAKGGSRAGSLLLDLVRTGIENDFERVVFPKYPELRDIKQALLRAGARYASLSGSGSTLYGLFGSRAEAARAAERLRKQGLNVIATSTLTRQQYWKKLSVSN